MNIQFKKGASIPQNSNQLSKANIHEFELAGLAPTYVRIYDSVASPLLKRIKDEYVGSTNNVRTFF